MLHEIDFGGIFLPPLLLHLAIAAVFFFIIRFILDWTGILARVWYKPLFELSLYVIVLATTVTLV